MEKEKRKKKHKVIYSPDFRGRDKEGSLLLFFPINSSFILPPPLGPLALFSKSLARRKPRFKPLQTVPPWRTSFYPCYKQLLQIVVINKQFYERPLDFRSKGNITCSPFLSIDLRVGGVRSGSILTEWGGITSNRRSCAPIWKERNGCYLLTSLFRILEL